jgi:single-strand DNA-binding protein
MNKTILIGRVTRDIELKYTQNGTAVAKFNLAVDRRVKQGEDKQADFISCVAWGKQAEFVSKYFAKGSGMALVGRIQTGSYENSEGKKVYTTDVIVEEVNFVGGKKSEGQQAAPQVPDTYAPINDDDDLPF